MYLRFGEIHCKVKQRHKRNEELTKQEDKSMSKVVVMDHPLIQHKIGIIRKRKQEQRISDRISARSQC